MEERLSLKQIVKKLNVPYSTLHYWMVKNKIPRRKFKIIKIPKKKLIDLYVNRKLGTKEIAELYKCCEETIRKKLIKFGIPRRSNSESKTKYPKKKFSGDKLEKAYMIGFRIGDLYVKRNHGLIRICTTTTHKLMLKVIKLVFGKYGHLMIKKRVHRGLKEYLITVDLDNSFEFLLKKIKKIPLWIIQGDEYFFSFLAGYADAEGYWPIWDNGRGGVRFKFGISTQDNLMLQQIKNKLTKLRFRSHLYLAVKKGAIRNYGKLKKDFYQLCIVKNSDVIKLAQILLQLSHHPEKIMKMKLLLKGKNKKWIEVKPKVERLKKLIRRHIL